LNLYNNWTCSFFFLKAVEVSEAKRSATAKLAITVKPVDSNPPVITASNIEGFVDENAPIGTKVIDESGNPIVLTVSDADLVSLTVESISFYLTKRDRSVPIEPFNFLYC